MHTFLNIYLKFIEETIFNLSEFIFNQGSLFFHYFIYHVLSKFWKKKTHKVSHFYLVMLHSFKNVFLRIYKTKERRNQLKEYFYKEKNIFSFLGLKGKKRNETGTKQLPKYIKLVAITIYMRHLN